jgi:hypothetical protein
LTLQAIRTCASLPRMFWPPRDPYPYDEPFAPARDRERLRHLVFLDGRLIDTWTEPVETTVYQSIADELDREKSVPHYPQEPLPPPYERVLTWLDAAVGGRIALLALDDDPLHEVPPTEDDVTRVLERVARELFDTEFLQAARNALETVRRTDPALLEEAAAPDVAAGLCWLLGRANGLVGARTSVTQKVLKRALWLSSSPTRRSPRIKTCLRGLVAEPGPRPPECPDLLELGNPTYLTSPTRHRLIVLRDRALATAEQAEADHRAREALAPGHVDSLTS